MKALLRKLPRLLHPPSAYRLQILSDLHLEIGQQYTSYTFPASAPLLLLAGDVGRLIDYDGYLKFLQAQASRYEKVFLVLGNHEFYGLDYETGLHEARRLSDEPTLSNTLILLDRVRWDDPNSTLTILGCTLWSAIPEHACQVVESKVHDFKKINRWTIQKHNQVHVEETAWLRQQVALLASQDHDSKRRLLVATHHAPCVEGSSRPEHSRNPWTPAFATDLVEQEGWDGVKVWVFGHTHYSTNLLRNGIRVVANQRGYVFPGSTSQREQGKKANRDAHDFDDTKVIII
ncbi:Uncharacterized protein TOPH_02420 [Tolypocladium ophioglossoides CBS 100239]|uniref:Calcineurin-like phosphoesterase domain-containing protein n=1 Tax=Tolypocladium ophioglossoides (strain CBS 100239) TaxID=1163406 RepID=A0A0L0NFT5_TOLOC|nr:Uncharacterized protein TOPH_02420 [Tolypocladium ophioglossoides CBS 100239]